MDVIVLVDVLVLVGVHVHVGVFVLVDVAVLVLVDVIGLFWLLPKFNPQTMRFGKFNTMQCRRWQRRKAGHVHVHEQVHEHHNVNGYVHD